MRNVYLVGAKELEDGVTPLPMAGGRNADLAATLGPQDWFDAYALRLNPDRAQDVTLNIDFSIAGADVSLGIARQVEFARMNARHTAPDARVTLSLALLEQLSAGAITLKDAKAQGVKIEGREEAVSEWLELHDTFELWFDIVTP